MTSDDRFGGTVSVWLQQRAGTGAPDYLDDILGRTARTRQRPGWTSIERWPPMDISASRTVLPSRFPVRSLALLAIIGVLLVAVAAIVAVGSRPRLPEPFGPARNGALVYAADGDIFRLEIAAGVPSLIVGGPTDDHSPMYSRDGTKLLFRRSVGRGLEQVLVAPADGSTPRIVTSDLAEIGAIDWSPDGTQFAVLHLVLGHGALSIVDATGKEPIRTLDLGDIDPRDWIAWRPETGGRLFFKGEPRVETGEAAIFAVDEDGSSVGPVTPLVPDEGVYNHPSISADGARLTYWNFEPSVSDGRTDGWSHVLDLVTGEDRQVRLADAEAEIQGKFSPDGSRLLFESQKNLPDGTFSRQIVVGPSDGDVGGALVDIGQPFVDSTGTGFGFAFTPDGEQVLLTIGPTTQIYDATDGTPVGEPMTIGELPTYQRLAP